jgi:hypothetical protein
MSKSINNKPKAAKKRMQDVNFKNVDDLFAFLPEEELNIVERLRKIVFSCIPDCTEKLSYNVPFYKKHKNICFIWPPSVKWGGKGHEGVRFGFTNGYLLTDEIGYLDKGTRKQVYWRDFGSIKEIDAELLRAYIFEAALIDEEMMREKAKSKK